MRLYHGSPHAERILKSGFDLWAPRTSDVGDLGWGIYFTNEWMQARQYAGAKGGVVEVDVDIDGFLRIDESMKALMRGPSTDDERLWRSVVPMDEQGRPMTVSITPESAREDFAKEVRETLLARGVKGVISGPQRRGLYEVVVYDPATIRSVRRAPQPHDNPTSLVGKLKF